MTFHRKVYILALAFLMQACSPTLEVKQQNNHPPHPNDAAYESLVKSLKAKPTLQLTIALRTRYPSTERFAFTRDEKTLSKKLSAAVAREDWPTCIRQANQALALNYTSLNGHYAAMVCYFESSKTAQGQHHESMLNLLLEAIWTTGDGESSKTAFHVANRLEKEDFIEFHGLQVVQKTTLNENGQLYFVMTLNDAQKNEIFNWYFIQAK